MNGTINRREFIQLTTAGSALCLGGSGILAFGANPGGSRLISPGCNGPAAPYKLRTVMERKEGVTPQVFMRIGQKVTQAKLVGTDFLPYFTGEIIDASDIDRGCRTKITVKVDGDIEKLWKNWSSGLHRQTCYGDITKELGYFCKFKEIKMVNEAV